MEKNCLALCTKFSQTDCYILYCPLQSIFSFLDESKFIMFSTSLTSSVAFLWILTHLYPPELGPPKYALATASAVVNRGESFFHISLAMFLLIKLLPYFVDLLILLSITIPVSDSAVLIPTYFSFYICMCCI